jgi:hypothetical protein
MIGQLLRSLGQFEEFLVEAHSFGEIVPRVLNEDNATTPGF